MVRTHQLREKNIRGKFQRSRGKLKREASALTAKFRSIRFIWFTICVPGKINHIMQPI